MGVDIFTISKSKPIETSQGPVHKVRWWGREGSEATRRRVERFLANFEESNPLAGKPVMICFDPHRKDRFHRPQVFRMATARALWTDGNGICPGDYVGVLERDDDGEWVINESVSQNTDNMRAELHKVHMDYLITKHLRMSLLDLTVLMLRDEWRPTLDITNHELRRIADEMDLKMQQMESPVRVERRGGPATKGGE